MALPATTDRLAYWVQALSLVLALAIGVQGVPLQALVQSVQSPSPHHECSHARDYCPMNPNGPCQCNHTETGADGTTEPTFQACTGGGSTIISTAVWGKWLLEVGTGTPVPQKRPFTRRSTVSTLSPQRVGDDVFRPPRTEAEPWPVKTLQASRSA